MSLKFMMAVVAVLYISASKASAETKPENKGPTELSAAEIPTGSASVAASTAALSAEVDKKLAELPHKEKSLESQSQQSAVTLYRHDQGAGVYRTEAGDLVRMYRVERGNGGPGQPGNRRAGPARRPPTMPKTREGNGEGLAPERQRMYDWFSQYYGNPYGLGTYSYNYNYDYGYPSTYGNYYSPYYTPYYGSGGYYPYGGLYGYGY